MKQDIAIMVPLKTAKTIEIEIDIKKTGWVERERVPAQQKR